MYLSFIKASKTVYMVEYIKFGLFGLKLIFRLVTALFTHRLTAYMIESSSRWVYFTIHSLLDSQDSLKQYLNEAD